MGFVRNLVLACLVGLGVASQTNCARIADDHVEKPEKTGWVKREFIAIPQLEEWTALPRTSKDSLAKAGESAARIPGDLAGIVDAVVSSIVPGAEPFALAGLRKRSGEQYLLPKKKRIFYAGRLALTAPPRLLDRTLGAMSKTLGDFYDPFANLIHTGLSQVSANQPADGLLYALGKKLQFGLPDSLKLRLLKNDVWAGIGLSSKDREEMLRLSDKLSRLTPEGGLKPANGRIFLNYIPVIGSAVDTWAYPTVVHTYQNSASNVVNYVNAGIPTKLATDTQWDAMPAARRPGIVEEVPTERRRKDKPEYVLKPARSKLLTLFDFVGACAGGGGGGGCSTSGGRSGGGGGN